MPIKALPAAAFAGVEDILRLLLTAALIAGVGIALYLLVPVLRRKFRERRERREGGDDSVS